MKEVTIRLKDESKYDFLLELLKQLDFVEFQLSQKIVKVASQDYDFFQSAGLFANRDIDANELRKQAWRITK